MRLPIQLLLAAAVLVRALAAQGTDQICVLEGSRSDDLALRLYAESSPSTAPKTVLSGLQIQPIEVTTRTFQMQFVPGRARLVERPLWRFVELPGGRKLLHYRRTDKTGTSFGFLLLLASGAPVVVHETAALALGANPYHDRIGVAPDGKHACLNLKSGAIFVALLDGSVFASTKRPARALTVPTGVAVEPAGIAVGATHVFLVTNDDKIRRCALADGNQPVDLTPAGVNSPRLKEGLAPSGDGKSVAFLYGPKDSYSIYLLGSTGSARKLPPAPAKYEEPGYLPEISGGPRLLLNDDATRLMYVDATIRDEIYLLDTTGATKPTHITSDANFKPYIGVGILPAFASTTVVMAVGNPNLTDWFSATTGGTTVLNLTGTGPNKSAPFDAGKLDPVGAFLTADRQLVTMEQDPKTGAISTLQFDPTKGTRKTLVSAIRGTPAMGEALGGAPTVLLPGRSGDIILDLQPTRAAIVGPPGVHVSAEAVGPSGSFGVLLARAAGSTGPALPVLHVHGVGVALLPLQSVDQFVLTRSGGAVVNGAAELRYLAVGVNAKLASNAAIRLVVSGASQ